MYKTSKVREILVQPLLPRHLVIVRMNTSATKVKKKHDLVNFMSQTFFFHLKNQKQKQKKLENGEVVFWEHFPWFWVYR